jgi:hypothetical protein
MMSRPAGISGEEDGQHASGVAPPEPRADVLRPTRQNDWMKGGGRVCIDIQLRHYCAFEKEWHWVGYRR